MILIRFLIKFLIKILIKRPAGAIFEEYLRKIIDFPYEINQNMIKLINLIRKISAAGEKFPYF